MYLHLCDGLSIHLHGSNEIRLNDGCAGNMSWYNYTASCQN